MMIFKILNKKLKNFVIFTLCVQLSTEYTHGVTQF